MAILNKKMIKKNTFRICVKKLSFPRFLALIFLLLFVIIFNNNLAYASETLGTIDGTYKYAWGENIGWVNFACDNCNINITDNGISGDAWSKQYGWINLNPTTSGIKNNGEGLLSGSAWSSNLGWINFTGVTIDTRGDFWGYATIKSDNSRINFNCANADSCSSANFKVKTDWRPASVRPHNTGGGYMPPNPPVLPPPIITPPTNPIVNVVDKILNFFNPKNKIPETNIVQIPKIAPLAFGARWNLLPVEAIKQFVFAPLPYEIRILASKFPEFSNTLKNVGVKRFTDINKLTGVTLNMPNLAQLLDKTIKTVGVEKLGDLNNLNGVALGVPGLPEINGINGKLTTDLNTGKIVLIKGLPLAKFSVAAKQNLPSEFVFARADNELVDLKVAMSIGDNGAVNQQMSTLPGQTLRLVVKPISKARSVTGYFVFKSATPRISMNNPIEIPRSSLTASALSSLDSLVETVPTPIPVENKLVLSSFEYTDPDHDGIYTADVVSPITPGEYEVITIIDYIDPVLGIRRMSIIAVVDPEGYVFEKNNGKETRIPSAIVSLYTLNNVTKKYELWPAKSYQQENPQTTDIRGTYSFLVPEGSYYISIEAPGYDLYKGKVFVVTEGSGIHQNVELKSSFRLPFNLDFQTILLVVVLLLLVYNWYRNNLRDKLLKSLN